MKTTIYALSLALLFASCQSGPEGETAQATEKQDASASQGGTIFQVDTTNSVVTFIGTKPIGTHEGDMHILQGTLNVDQGNITGGKFTIDMTRITIKDKDTNYSFKLVGHLLSPDFFDVAKYPSANFEITGVEALTNDSTGTHRISGNLTLKDSTKNISFPARVSVSDAGITANADFNIDRTQWGLFYGNDKSLGDKFIYPEVKIKFNLQAKP